MSSSRSSVVAPPTLGGELVEHAAETLQITVPLVVPEQVLQPGQAQQTFKADLVTGLAKLLDIDPSGIFILSFRAASPTRRRLLNTDTHAVLRRKLPAVSVSVSVVKSSCTKCNKCVAVIVSVAKCASFGFDCSCQTACKRTSVCEKCIAYGYSHATCQSAGVNCACDSDAAIGSRRMLGHAAAANARELPAVAVAVSIEETSSAESKFSQLMRCLELANDVASTAACNKRHVATASSTNNIALG